jgi:hypothetical protein
MSIEATERFAPAARVVTPRRRKHKRLPVVAIDGQNTLTEHGEVGTVADLIATLPDREPTLFVKHMAADFLARLDNTFRDTHTSWQWRASERETAINQAGVRVASRVTTTVHFFGFQNGQYHKIIDPVALHSRNIDDVMPGDEPQIIRLLKWAVAIRDFCDENNLEVKPTAGSISAQLLTDPRFYPNARRKVPLATNNSARENLPGNFYHLSVRPGPQREYTAYYIDQRRAHHYHAGKAALPHSDHLYAHGMFQESDRCIFAGVWDGFCGLYCLDLDVPQDRRTNPLLRNWLRHQPSDTILERRFIYSNELDFLTAMGYTVRGVRSAWGSQKQDTGIAKYSEWANEQLDIHNEARWIKPLLLSAYGVLARRPQIAEALYRTAKRGTPRTIPVGQHNLTGVFTKGRHKLEPGIANVLHRGMIEAATRVESVSYAVYLMHAGYKILSVYADAVMVEVDDDQPLPLIIDPWRLKETLHHLQFINTHSFQSGEMTKMPGVPGISKDSARHRQATPGRAPRIRFEALTGKTVLVDGPTRTKKVGIQ